MCEAKQLFLAHGLAASPSHADAMVDILESNLSREAAVSLLWLASKKGEAFDIAQITPREIKQAILEVKAAELFSSPARGRA